MIRTILTPISNTSGANLKNSGNFDIRVTFLVRFSGKFLSGSYQFIAPFARNNLLDCQGIALVM